MTVPSPCRNICTVDRATRNCTVCGRTLEEIAHWSSMTDAERQAVLDRLAPMA